MKYKNKVLFDYVENGGNLIVQYNTTNNLVTNELAPFELKLSRERVTNENAPVTFLSKNHQLHYQAGAGLVAASIPENELQETYNKLGALTKALEIAETI